MKTKSGYITNRNYKKMCGTPAKKQNSLQTAMKNFCLERDINVLLYV